jgi:hypothetical protein
MWGRMIFPFNSKSVDKFQRTLRRTDICTESNKINKNLWKNLISNHFYTESVYRITHSYPQLMAVIHSFNGFIHSFI